MDPSNQRGERVLREVLARAATDAEFRARLLSEPEDAIYDATGVAVPPAYRVRFVEKPPDVDLLVVLPDLARPSGELNDEDLDAVAGGGDVNAAPW